MSHISPEIIEFKKYLQDNFITGIALDIDDTLSQTKKYWFEYFSRIIGNPEKLTSDEFCQKYPLIQDAPYFQTQEAKELIFELSNSSQVYRDLEIIDNSLNSVNKINQTIPVVAYITMRPHNSILATQDWLNKHNFPKARLISRPDSLSIDSINNWKADILQELYPNIIGIVDDSVNVINQLPSTYQGKIYWYNSDTKNYRTDINIVTCANWESVIEQVQKDFSSK